MKLTILGNNGPYPEQKGACSGYLLEKDDTHVLIDCGCGVLPRLVETTDISRLNGIILSHLHFDHMSDVLVLQYYLQFHPTVSPIDLYAPETPREILSLIRSPSLRIRNIASLERIGAIEFSTIPVRHPIEAWAVSAQANGKRFVYTGDTNTHPGLSDFCMGADILLADAGLSAADHNEKAPHLSARLCGQLACKANAHRLLLTHFNPRYAKQDLLQEARAEFPETYVAELLSTWTI